MKLVSRLFLGFGVFLIVASVVYGLHAHDYEGLTLSVTVAGGALLIGAYGASVLRQTRVALDRAAAEPGPVGVDEPHVGPTIWPVVFAVSAAVLVIGAVANRWALVPGGVFFVAASVGWVLDVHRQWHQHAAGHQATGQHTAGHHAVDQAAGHHAVDQVAAHHSDHAAVGGQAGPRDEIGPVGSPAPPGTDDAARDISAGSG